MDLRQLNALLAVADTGSFSAAARALHTVQSNVSTHVARLERELDATLVDRASGTLTEEGEVVAARARIVARELDALVSDLAALHADVVGRVRLGVIGTTARWLVPPLVVALESPLPARGPGHRRRHHDLVAAPGGERRTRPGGGRAPRRRARSGH